MNKTLKDIRINALQYSKKDMATKLGMSLSDYKKEENEPLEMSILIRLSNAVGKTIDYLLNMQKQEIKFEIDDAWQSVDDLKDKLNEFIKKSLSVYEDTDDGLREVNGYYKQDVSKTKSRFCRKV